MPGPSISHELPTITLNRDLTLSPLPAIVLREIPKIMGEVPARYPTKPPDPPVHISINPQPTRPAEDVPKRHADPPSCDVSSDGLSNTTTSCASSSSSSVNYEHFSCAYSETSSVPRTYIHQSVRQSILYKKMSSSEESVFKMTFDEWKLLNPEQRRGKTASDSVVDWRTLPTWFQQPPLRSSSAKYNLSSEINEKLVVWKGDITRLDCEAIVNETDERCMGCGSPQEVNLYQVAGRLLERECASFIGDIKVGQVRVTKGYKLPSLFVLHTLGPEGQNPDKLRSCYTTVLNLCVKMGIRTVAIPCIGTARHIYPLDKACHVGLQSIREWMQVSGNLDKLDRCILTCHSPLEYRTYKEICPIYFPTEKAASKEVTSPRSKKKPIVPVLITNPSLNMSTSSDTTPNISSPKLAPSSPPSTSPPPPQLPKEVLADIVETPSAPPLVVNTNTPIRITVPKTIRKPSVNKETEVEPAQVVLGEEMPSPPPKPTPRHCNRPAAVLTLNPNAILPTSVDPRLIVQPPKDNTSACEPQPSKPKPASIKITKSLTTSDTPTTNVPSSNGRRTPSRAQSSTNSIAIQPTTTDEMQSTSSTDSNTPPPTNAPQTVLSPRKKKERCLSPSTKEGQVLSPRKTGNKCLPSSPKATTPSKNSPRAWSTWMWDKGHL